MHRPRPVKEQGRDGKDKPISTIPLDPEGLIDVKALIARYSGAEHAARANAYFGGMTDDAKVLRKPFFGLRETQANLHGIAEVLNLLRLFLGARVLDFGAGTGWFSRMLALLECKPIAVDVSAIALDLGRRACERDPLLTGLPIEWRSYDGVTLPLGDESVDRIVCYDSFHHVADQAAVLREFHRVLVPGGRAAFHEPGPQHSKSPVSQYEMRQHQVIENDIVIEDIWALAEPMGFTALELALNAPRSPVVDLAAFNRIIGGGATLKDMASLLQGLTEAAASLRIFAMTKGAPIEDSRAGTGLAGEVAVQLTQTAGDTLHGRARVTNTGIAVWRPSIDEVGGVWLGVREPDSKVRVDVGRIWLSGAPVMPGQAVEVDFAIPAPESRPVRVSFDLVAEFVVWFEELGAAPVSFLIE
jgi:SAM-dependent methyltransferase